MSVWRFLITVVFACVLAVPKVAVAALVERDLYAPGDGLITYDTETNLEWLDLSQTAGMSYNDVKNRTGALAGWNWANAGTLETLRINAGINFNGSTRDGTYVNNMYAFVDLVGATLTIDSTLFAITGKSESFSGFVAETETAFVIPATDGIFANFDPPPPPDTPIIVPGTYWYAYTWGGRVGDSLEITYGLDGFSIPMPDLPSFDPYVGAHSIVDSELLDFHSDEIGAWLYRTATPIPGAVWLLGSGLIGLVGIRRKMKG